MFLVLPLAKNPDQKSYTPRFPRISHDLSRESSKKRTEKLKTISTEMEGSGIPPAPPTSHGTPPPVPLTSHGTPPPAPRPPPGSHHSRSFSQPAFFSLDSLPPLGPSPYRKSSPTSSLSDSADLSPAPVRTATGDGLPPRKLHRRSCSDIPPGFLTNGTPTVKSEPDFEGMDGSGERKSDGNLGDDLFDAFLNLDGFGMVDESDYRRDEMDSRRSGNSKNGANSSESEAESSAIDFGGVCESAPVAVRSRHFRSISVDGLMGRLNFGEESPRVPTSPGLKRSQGSRGDSMDEAFSLEFGNGEFSGTELKKIMTDKRLEEIALADPKRAKRILANRQSAARSKERKLRYISELERKVQTLQSEATTLSAQLTLLQRDSAGLATQNNELKIRLQAMEQQAQLRDALNEALTGEVQRLRLATAELDDSLPKQMKAANSMKT
ncbi:hypothetical protein HPP92_022245 [Vanilla planifolia]|uniref:BZIP domain-containing protein n=1 Tax=Vanilla planifolia TaxID=51239 RepID=A0A835UDC3_VANPL|nr:hypothetical protein HPP92_022245 [Vanilla planifolia]